MAFSASSAINRASAETSTSEAPNIVNQEVVKTKVFVTSPQMESLVFRALGDSVEIYVLLRANDDPHTYEPTLKDLKSYREADIIILENRVASLESQEHIGKKFIICEHSEYLKQSQERKINTDHKHVSYNIFAYQTALNILNNEVLTEEQKLANKAGLEKEQEKIDQFIEHIASSAAARAQSKQYSAILAIEGIANPLAEHWYFEINALKGQDDVKPFIIPMRISSVGCGEHSHGETSGKTLLDAIMKLQENIKHVCQGQLPNSVIFLGDEASINQIKKITITTSTEGLTDNFRYVTVSHNMDKVKFESYIEWLEDALMQLEEAAASKPQAEPATSSEVK
jgi:hypothetical protein